MKLSGTIAILLASIVAVFAAACSSSGTPTTGFTTYTDSINGFSVSVPASWGTEYDDSEILV